MKQAEYPTINEYCELKINGLYNILDALESVSKIN